jgi:hypothetical protein
MQAIKDILPGPPNHQSSKFVGSMSMDGQPAWRFCDKCFGMFFNGDPDPNRKGRCPADGGMHAAQGFVFYLPHDVPDTAGQPGWRFCDKCFGMFFNGDPNRKGRCPADGDIHRAQGDFLFVLPHRAFPSPSITIRAIADQERFIEVEGSGFEPNQPAQIKHQVRLFPSGDFQPPDAPRNVTSDSAGRLSDRIPIDSDISSATVSAFDFGSGETSTATLGN